MSDVHLCIRCGNPITGRSKTAIYCSDFCRKEMEVFRRKNKNQIRTNVCAKCGKEFIPHQFGEGRRYCFDCVPDGLSTGAEIRKQIKKWSLEYKGNKCSICGYDKCIEALEFHHIDMSEKEFNLSDRNLKLDWQEIKRELDKCIVVCANCHRELHAKQKYEGE